MKRTFSVVVALALAIPFGIPAFGASTTGGNHAPITVSSDSDLENNTCLCVVSGKGTPGDPFVIGPWTIMASAGPGVSISHTTKSFTLPHLTVHTTGTKPAVVLNHVQGLKSHVSTVSLTQINIDSPGSSSLLATNIGVDLVDTSGVTIAGDSINTMGGWGIRIMGTGTGSLSHDNFIQFMTVAHAGLANPSSASPEAIPGPGVPAADTPWVKGVTGDAPGGLLLKDTHNNVVADSLFNEDAYAGIELVGAHDNTIGTLDKQVVVRYPDYFGTVLQSSDHNVLNNLSLQAADFDGLLVRHSNFNEIEFNTFSANGPIGTEWVFPVQIVPYFIAGAYVGWGSHDNIIKHNNGNFGNTGTDLVIDKGAHDPATTFGQTLSVTNFVLHGALQKNNPFNSDPGPPGSLYRSFGISSFADLAAGSNTVCGNSFAPTWWYPADLAPNRAC